MNLKKNIYFFDNIDGIELPKKFTFPFQYVPHKLSKIAVSELQNYLEIQTDFTGNFDKLGKMFGVLVVRTSEGKVGYLKAFSGKIDEKVFIDGFVPPIFDTLNPNGFFKMTEKITSGITKQIFDFQQGKKYQNVKQKLIDTLKQQELEIINFKSEIRKAKKIRDIKRKETKSISEDEFLKIEQQLSNESIRLNYLLKDLKREWIQKVENIKQEISEFEKPLNALKVDRKEKSANSQRRLHQSYQFLNANGEIQNLLDIFEDYPPAGSGECALPKLLNYAYQQNLKPLAMAEFWWGKSPSSEIKVHKQFYPSCKSKCKPILGFMLKGLEVEENPVKNRENIELDILFEDDYIVVLNKPHGFLSVDGKEIKDSVCSRMKKYLPNSTGMLMVHRLDMATSGLLVISKTSEVHKNLQQQFTDRTVKKRYIAILNGILAKDKGRVILPLRVDYHNRPRQLVCHRNGKLAITRYEVVDREKGKTKIHLFPETGRTHQLRVHCAHSKGLKIPIVGDVLYGNPSKRLFLHAERIEFTHPITNKRVSFFCESGF